MTLEYRKHNINNHVKVRLTEAGREFYKQYWAKIGIHNPTLNLDDDGFVEFQMHDLIQIFGSQLFMGNPNLPFGTNIQIQVWEPEEDGE